MSVLLAAAKKRGEPVPHLLVSGPAGLGKTTLARIVASEMNGRLVEMVGSSVRNPSEMTAHLMELKSNDVLFVDEVHALPRRIEEAIYPAMEDGVVLTDPSGFDAMMKQIGVHGGGRAKSPRRLPPFTLIGATTLAGLVSAPLRSRFRQILELEAYGHADLQRIVSDAAKKLAFDLPDEFSMAIARRSRGTARAAISHLYWYRDVVQGDGDVPTMDLLRLAFEMKGVDEHGLTRADRDYLQRLIESAEPVGVETLATAMGESVETIEAGTEPFLIREGYVRRTPRGRVATEKARALFEEVTT